MAHRIAMEDILFDKIGVDPCGRIFRWDGKLFRAISVESKKKIEDLFRSGLLDELSSRNLMPASRLTDFDIEGYGLVVEHQEIKPVIYPFEWTFSMLKDAALTVLEVNRVAKKYGYTTIDCHPYNICFNNCNPQFVDLGSFVKTEGKWPAYEEFVKSYIYPLNLWKHGNSYLARKLLFSLSLSDSIPHESYFLYKNFFFRHLSPYLTKRVSQAYSIMLRMKKADLERLSDKVSRINKKSSTEWTNYQAEYYDESGMIVPNARFGRIAEIIKDTGINSVVELGGNRGAFSEFLKSRAGIERMVCTDYDEGAVDLMYQDMKRKSLDITPALVDMMFPLMNYYEEPPYERFRSEAVVVLAVTHHLLLTQKLSIDLIFEIIARYTNRYALVEFMPLGLHDGKSAPPLPAWYNRDWFRASFKSHFRPIIEEQLEENRILFFGEIEAKPATAE